MTSPPEPHSQPGADGDSGSRSGLLAQWLIGCLLGGVGLAWLAVRIQNHAAPVILFPLLVGGALGCLLAWWSQPLGDDRRRELLLGLTVAVAALVVSQYVWSYVDYRRAFELARLRHPQIELFESLQGKSEQKGFGEYVSALVARGRTIGNFQLVGWQIWASWAVDAVLQAAAAWVAFRCLRPRSRQQPT